MAKRKNFLPPKPGRVLDMNDRQRGIWGGLPERDGRRVEGRVYEASKAVFYFELVVRSTDGTLLQGPVLFHLDGSYAKNVIRIKKIQLDNTAVFGPCNANRLFNVGVQVLSANNSWVGLEFDLASLDDLPKKFHPEAFYRKLKANSRETHERKPMDIEVKGQRFQAFVEALVKAFPTPQRMDRMLQFRLEKDLARIVSLNNELDQIAFELIRAANAEGWTAELLVAARESAPNSPHLLRFAEDYGLASVDPKLERRVRDDLPFIDITKWRKRLGEIEAQVCRVEIPADRGVGTGFLLGPDVVITNYHVMKSVIQGQKQPDQVVLRFDYKRMDDGTTLNPGVEFRLAPQNWLIDHSPYSQTDLLADPGQQVPDLEELDYALLRVDGEPGNQKVGGDKAEPESPARKWIEPRAQAFDFPTDGPLFIVQHPEAAPLKLALDTKSVIGPNGNQTRVRYRTSTEPGSSGSPVFNVDWEWVALHHSGDRAVVPQFNQGIPVPAILDLLEKRGHKKKLGAQE